MSLALIRDIILRTLSDPNYTAKGSELTWEELDTNQKILADAILELAEVEIEGVEPYDPGEENSLGDIRTYDGNTWEYINAIPQTGVTPGTDASTWAIASQGLYSHLRNKDEKLAEGTADEVTAAEIRAFIDSLGGLDAIPTDGSDNAVSSNGVFDALATKLNLSGGTLTGTLRTADGDATNKAIALGGPATGVWRDRAVGDRLKWVYNGVDFLWMSETLFIIKNTLNLEALTASRVLELDGSKNVISVAKATGYNLPLGSTAGTVCEGNDLRLTTTQRVKVALSSAQILNMFSSPVVLVPAPGSGFAIDVISIMIRFTYGTIAYSGNTNLVVQSSHVSALAIGSNSVILPSAVNRMGAIAKSGISGVAANQYQENASIQITTQTGNPSAGDGTLDVYITYGIVTL